jgi:hypothetical protein
MEIGHSPVKQIKDELCEFSAIFWVDNQASVERPYFAREKKAGGYIFPLKTCGRDGR